jgi:hypothetical protein
VFIIAVADAATAFTLPCTPLIPTPLVLLCCGHGSRHHQIAVDMLHSALLTFEKKYIDEKYGS